MTLRQRIHDKLEAAFDPMLLEVHDDSEAHRGHAGWREGGETHFNVKLRAGAFDGLSRVAAQRAVYRVLAEEMRDAIHALALDVAGEGSG